DDPLAACIGAPDLRVLRIHAHVRVAWQPHQAEAVVDRAAHEYVAGDNTDAAARGYAFAGLSICLRDLCGVVPVAILVIDLGLSRTLIARPQPVAKTLSKREITLDAQRSLIMICAWRAAARDRTST